MQPDVTAADKCALGNEEEKPCTGYQRMDIQDERRRNAFEVYKCPVDGMAEPIEHKRSDCHSDYQGSPSTHYQGIRPVGAGWDGKHLGSMPLAWIPGNPDHAPVSTLDPNAPVVNDRYRATNQVRGVLPEDLLVGEGGGQIAVGIGLDE